jgi:hypothetical protein
VTIDIGRLPRRTLRAGAKLYRVHRKPPWYFDASEHGRFNPTGASDRGACCWAEKPLGAFVEAFRTLRTLTDADVAARSLSEIELVEDLVVGNLTVKQALAAGVTAAITSGPDYTEPQQLASDVQGVLHGLRYRARHDLSQQLIAIAWFGAAGSPTATELDHLPTPATEAIPAAVVAEAERLFGYEVLPTP